MARRHSGPCQRDSGDRCWYTSIDGKQVRLGAADEPYEAIEKRYFEVHAGKGTNRGPLTVHRLIHEFLAACRVEKKPGTVEWYENYLIGRAKKRKKKPFIETIPAGLQAVDLKRAQVERWVRNQYAESSESTKHAAYRSICRAYSWAMKNDLISRNPLFGIEKPTPEPREVVIKPSQYQRLLNLTTDQAFKDVLTFAWETGARANEIRVIESKHFDGEKFTIEKRNSKNKKYNRVILLTPAALAIVKRRMQPTGPIFRNTDNGGWTKAGLVSRFRRLRKATGIKGLNCTAFRHSWATRALTNGVSVPAAAALMGHRNATTILKNYAHVIGDTTYLLGELVKVPTCTPLTVTV